MIKPKTENFKVNIDRFVARSKARLQQFATEFTQDLNEAVVEATPVQTGFLRGSWWAAINGDPDRKGGAPDPGGGAAIARLNLVASQIKIGDVYRAANGAEYAWYVEYGTAAHDIYPREAKALHWVEGGRDIFRTKVHHPGTSPRAMVRGTLRRANLIAKDTIARVSKWNPPEGAGSK